MLSCSFRNIKIEHYNRLSSWDANMMAKKVHYQSCVIYYVIILV